MSDGTFWGQSDALTCCTVALKLTFFTSEQAGVYDVLKGSWFWVLMPKAKRCPAFVTISVKSLPQETCTTFGSTLVGSYHTVLSYLPSM
jgi:hypothetical protein